MIAIVVAIAASIAAGAAVERRSNRAARRLRDLTLRSMLWVLAPFAIFVNLAHAELELDALGGIAVALGSLLITGTIAWLLARGPLGLDRPQQGAAIHTSIQSNTGYLGLPIVALLFSHHELAQAIVYDIVANLATFVIGGFLLGAIYGTKPSERAALPLPFIRTLVLGNPVLLAAAAGLLAPQGAVPDLLLDPAKAAIFAMLPLGFLAVGITLADEADGGTLRIPPPLRREVATVVALRLALSPAIFLLVGSFLLDLPASYPLMAAMPVGLNTLVVAHATGLDLRLCASAITWSTAIAVVAVLGLTVTGAVG